MCRSSAERCTRSSTSARPRTTAYASAPGSKSSSTSRTRRHLLRPRRSASLCGCRGEPSTVICCKRARLLLSKQKRHVSSDSDPAGGVGMSDQDERTEHVDAALMRGLTQRRFSRRDALGYAGVSGGAVGLSAFLAACGVSGGKAKQTDVQKFWADKKQLGQLDFANWPYYIDVAEKGPGHPSLALFTKQTGIKVKYREVIQDDGSFYGKIQPVLAAGQ